MRNKRFIIALAGALIFGLIATTAVTRYLSNAQAYSNSLGNVVVARTSISLGSKITPEQLELAQIPNGAMPEGAFEKIDLVVGRVAITNIGVREPLTTLKLAADGSAGGLSAVIPEGYRAMTVSVNEVVGVSGFILPGSFVDIVVVTSMPDQSQGPISKIVLQSIKVLASGTNLEQPKDGREVANNVRVVTVLVTPEQAEKLALAGSEGRLQLVMRNTGDTEDANTGGATKRGLLYGDNAPVPTTPSVGADKQAGAAPPRRISPRRQFVMPPREVANPVAGATATPLVAPRKSVEIIEGAKKRSVELP
jgi:pilus assembly protein CpaB